RVMENNSSSLANVAHTMGEDIVSIEHPQAKPADANASKPITLASLPPGSRPYKAEAGDSVSRIASKMMGGNTKANRDALIAANPTLQQNANMVIAGRTYVIPPGTPSTPAATASGQTSQSQQSPAPATPATPATPAAQAPAPVAIASDKQPAAAPA